MEEEGTNYVFHNWRINMGLCWNSVLIGWMSWEGACSSGEGAKRVVIESLEDDESGCRDASRCMQATLTRMRKLLGGRVEPLPCISALRLTAREISVVGSTQHRADRDPTGAASGLIAGLRLRYPALLSLWRPSTKAAIQ